jgi:hypothetical protein
VIPRCIGGTLESTEVLCERCNHYFGDNIDLELAAHFEPIVTQFAPMMRAAYRRRQNRTFSMDGEVGLVRGAGGVVELDGIHRKYNDQGDLIAVYVPPHQADILRGIAAREAPGANFVFEDVPVTDVLAEPLTQSRMAFTDGLRRAVAKTILEVVDEFARRDGDPRFRRVGSLDPIRRFIRLGTGPRPEPSSPMANLGEEMVAVFRGAQLHLIDDRVAALSSDILVVYDARAARLFGLLTVGRSMPLVVSLAEGDDLGNDSWSLLVRRPLVPGEGSHGWLSSAAISWRDVEWARYSSSSIHAILLARAEYNAAFSDALGRAVLFVDQTDDREITESLRLLCAARGASGAAVVEALRARYLQNGVPDTEWVLIAQRVDAERIGRDDVHLRAAFRRELQGLFDRFGVPRALVYRGPERRA